MEIELSGISCTGLMEERFEVVLSDGAVQFLQQLHERFNDRRQELLQKRREREALLEKGELPDFLEETESIRRSDWRVSPVPKDLEDRRVEMTGPVDRKMIINGLNSGAKVFMADFEDAHSPTWSNTINGQINLMDAVNRDIRFTNESGKVYQLHEHPAVLMVRPRGLHLDEKHLLYNGAPMAASFVDFGLYMYHNARKLIQDGSGPYFYLPKLESHLEARLWNDVFLFAQEFLGISRGTVKATVLIETIMAAFEMDEILYELKEHSAGLNCGRWDYIFSYLKKMKSRDVVLPDRSTITMTVPFMRAYSQLTIQTCHRRKIHAMGGMAAQIPVRDDANLNALAFEKVRKDKEREVKDGHDGTWVAHPGMVQTSMDVFNKYMPSNNQIDRQDEWKSITREQLLEEPVGDISEGGLRLNINTGIQYVASWLSGRGAAPIHHLMEDAATAEISRAQVWQWIRHPRGVLMDGRKITLALYHSLKEEEMNTIRREVGEDVFKKGRFEEAGDLFDEWAEQEELEEFLTWKAYEKL
ncbi:malate synthase A [Halobacillus sp. ACCC02827]|uniref:malate synthase A n=1 Tax=Halobacillus sp. ACCC02827 TaxID=3052090 RepID=UPI00256FD193|nr:malate synthase A [Halobacillus sp. ACCC02827]WJE14802.1 malate synthase A [Halobacillus sp. ACCC02827]